MAGLFLLIVTLNSACSQDLLLDQQVTPSISLDQPSGSSIQHSGTYDEPTKPSPPPSQGEITWTFTPLSTQAFSVIEVPKEGKMISPMPQPMPQSPGEAALVGLAIKDLAGRLNISLDSVHFVQFESVVWPDGSLGCPQPGVEYPQVQREGYRIHLRYADRLYDYHGGENRTPFLCEMKISPAETPAASGFESP